MIWAIRFWIKKPNRDSVCDDSVSFSAWIQLQITPDTSCNVFEWKARLELAWNARTNFQFTWNFLNWLWFFLQLFHVHLIRVCLLMYKAIELGQKLGPISIALMIESLIEKSNILDFHDWINLPKLDFFHIFDFCTNFTACIGHICFTKRFKRSNLLFSYNLN